MHPAHPSLSIALRRTAPVGRRILVSKAVRSCRTATETARKIITV
ncbi:hypothetical protein FRUB_09683 [Fimbriiglobus ruber]|uniref:Uncharacterized protein n=1 Tax=Fimbriiglobus ruber TaxID=1908690 RepID=A0A225CZT5_9BACT|nr:hypothetical protein FRUB_09683 [Fimbriiglobus ruber]